MHVPVTGVIDAVLSRADGLQVACEAHSQLRRIEQQIRWASAKEDALSSAASEAGRSAIVSQVLLLRDTAANRSVVAQFGQLLELAYPVRHSDALAALKGEVPWPGAALIWCRVDGSRATILERPPRGIRLGR